MHKLVIVLVLALAVSVAMPQRVHQASAADPFVTGQVIVKFKPGTVAAARATAHSQAGGSVSAEIARTGVQLVAVARGQETAAIARYRQNPNVLYAEPNFIRNIPEPLSHPEGGEVLAQDFYFDQQWALHNTGQQFYCIPWIGGQLCLYVGTLDADIDAPEAWAITQGSSSIKVAVIDTGIDYTHPDLSSRYAGGYDFIFNDSDPADDQGHGTHVAGTIAGAMNNPTGDPPADEGVVGVAPLARILAYKVCRSDGSCSDFAIQQAIARAITDGAKVINMSLGGAEYSQSLDDSVQAAWSAGLVIVAGAGNDGNTSLFYPAALANVVSVAAFDEDHRRASFSTYGSWVDIAAPGNAILSTYPMSACGGIGATPGDQGCYNFLSGTSMATPHVSGAAALVWSRTDVTSNAQVVEILLNSADGDGVDTVRLDSWTISGGLNLHDALSLAGPPPPSNVAPVANAGPDQTVSDSDSSGSESIALNGSASSDSDGTITTYQWSEGGSPLATGATPTVSLGVGSHTLTLTVTDEDGAPDSDTVLITVNANQAPTANAGPDQSVPDVDGNGSQNVSLNGTGSFDSDGSLSSYVWTEGVTTLGTGMTPLIALATGTHTVTLAVTDNGGATDTDTVVITVNPPAACAPGNTGWLNPSAQAPTSGGDGDGFEIDPQLAFADGGGEAVNMDGRGDRHIFNDFGIELPAGCRVTGIELGLDWRLNTTAGSNRLSAELSWNGGLSWTRPQTDTTETILEHTAILGGVSNTWRRTWSASELNDANFRVRIGAVSNRNDTDFFLDWIRVRVSYGP